MRQHILRELEPFGRDLRAKVGLNHLQCHLLHAPLVRGRLCVRLCRGRTPGGGQSAAHVNGLHHGGTQPDATHAVGSIQSVRIEIGRRALEAAA